jgi:hypothetical protein
MTDLQTVIVEHLARLVDQTVRYEAVRLWVADSPGLDDLYSTSRTLTTDEVHAYVLAALDVAREQISPLSDPNSVKVETVQEVHAELWDRSLAPHADVRAALRGRWARELEQRNLRATTWPPIVVTRDRNRRVVRLTISGRATPNPTESVLP